MDDSLHQDVINTRENADCVITKHEISTAIDEVSRKLTEDIGSQVPIFLSVMKGGLVLTAELMQRMQMPMELDYIHIDRYRNKTQGNELRWHKEPDIDLTNRLVIVIDDIFDEGHTLQAVLDYCKQSNAGKVISVVLLKKQLQQKHIELEPDYVCVNVVDRYVFGCGMDYKGFWRNLDAVYAVSEG